jgi:membrane-associated protease RseP (regulator of RpoE activity)
MAPSPLDPLDAVRPTPGYAALERESPPPPPEPVRRRDPIVRHIVLFVLTLVMTTLIGAEHYYGFQSDFATAPLPPLGWTAYLNGLWYSLAILGILGAHEFGHYLTCRYYGVDASLPYFIPAPLLTGTLGAFIRIRQPIPNKRQLFDIGIAGPIAGFLVAIPVLILGISLSRVVRIPPGVGGLELGEPLLLQLIAGAFWGTVPDGSTLNIHPTAFAGWFGCLATALNLFPVGQLDGGHICYAVLGKRSTMVTYLTIVCLAGLSFVSSSWIVWTVLNVVMLFVFGPRHPRTADEDEPLDTARLWLAVFAVVMFAVCFTPAPIEPMDLVPAGR